MADTLLFDRLRYLDKLRQSGISEDHARAHAEALDEALRDTVATKRDLLEAIHGLRHDLTIRTGGIAVALFAALATIKFFG